MRQFWRKLECDSVKGEIEKLELSSSQKYDSLITVMEANEKGHKATYKEIREFMKKIDGFMHGNGAPGIRTEIALIQQETKNMEGDIKGIGKKAEDARKKAEAVDRKVLVNSTKMYCLCAGISFAITLAAIFVPMAWR